MRRDLQNRFRLPDCPVLPQWLLLSAALLGASMEEKQTSAFLYPPTEPSFSLWNVKLSLTIAPGLLVFKYLFLYILAVSLTRLTWIWGHQRDGGNVAGIKTAFPRLNCIKLSIFRKLVLKWGGWGITLQEKTVKVVNFMLEQYDGGFWFTTSGFGGEVQLLTTITFYCKGPLLSKPCIIKNWHGK